MAWCSPGPAVPPSVSALDDACASGLGSVPAMQIRGCRCTVAQTPDVRRKRRHLLGVELGPALGRHRGTILLGLRHTLSDRAFDCSVAAIAPQPSGAGEIGT